MNDLGSTIMIYAGVVVILSMDIGLLFTGQSLSQQHNHGLCWQSGDLDIHMGFL